MSYLPIQDEQPEINPNWYEYLSCSWMNPLLELSKTGLLSEKDFYQFSDKDKAKNIRKKFDWFWNEFKRGKKPSLLIALFNAIKVPLAGSLTADLVSRLTEVATPLVLQKIVLLLYSPSNAIYFYASGMVILQFLELLCDSFRIMTSRRVDQIIRSILTTAIYEKSFRLSSKARLLFPEGKVMNLVNQDINVVSRGFEYFTNCVWIPLRLVFSLYFLYRLLGDALWVSLGIVVFVTVISVSITPLLKHTYTFWLEASDTRIGIIRELLYGIKVVKYNCLEEYFKIKVHQFRKTQIYNLILEYWLIFTVQVIVYSSILMMICASVVVYSWMGNEMTADIIFPAVLYFGNLRDPLFRITINLKLVVQGFKSLDRIHEFLLADEQEYAHAPGGGCILAANASFVWPSLDDNNEFVLSGVDLDIQPNTLVGVVGSVGSGKSALLASIIGQMDKAGGSINVSGTVAYCAQQPWIITGTIEQNILFHLPKRKEWLDKVVEMCGLLPDLALLSSGIHTEIGENGVNLSGGQKARLSLARAIYSDADILLLDDPLSALDAKVGRQVFTAIKALPKTVLLVTHHLQYVNQLDHIIVLENGRIVESSSFTKLIQHESKLKQLVNNHVFEEETVEKKEQVEQIESFVEPEEKNSGIVQAKTYFDYIKSLGGFKIPIAFILIYSVLLVSKVSGPIWLSFWTLDKENDGYYMKYFTIISGIEITAAGAFHFICAYLSIVASCKLHDESFAGLLSAPLSFFDQNPIGRILNRMSKDVFAVDKELALWILDSSLYMASLVSSLVLICTANYYILLIFSCLSVIMYRWFTLYRFGNIEFQRFSSVMNSPLDCHFTETLAGITNIKVYSQEQKVMDIQKELTDKSLVAMYLKKTLTGWMIFRVKLFAWIITIFVILAAIQLSFMEAGRQYISFIAMALTYSSSLPYSLLNFLVVITRLEGSMNSVERLTHYASNIPKENDDGEEPAENWPSAGSVEIIGLDLYYASRPDYPVVRDLNVKINAGEKIGIVGRTGSGKSTLASAFFRIIEPANGAITIDRIGSDTLTVDISTVPLKTLRKRLQMIPQDPVLFEGTIRSNLDFEKQFSDEAIWSALDHSGIKGYICSLGDKLDSVVSQNGDNLSVGQRQLLCLARAILAQPKFLVMDEATASIDLETDALIQRAIKKHFQHTTVLCIAHRLNTIADFDRVLVLEKGEMVAFDTPAKLLENKDSLFSQMVDASGKNNAKKVREIALQRKYI